jgi:hypothetical protein
MTEIFVNRDYTVVGFYRTLLEEAGIACHIRNEFSHNMLTDIPIPSFYPALCVMRDEDAGRAVEIIREYQRGVAEDSAASGADWLCPACGETVPAAFGSCWKCEAARPTAAE